ncbi:MAG: hypothetical protein KAR40_11255 [Candidatus Sabulitectum sp.]|nr:hypothetical protein [Candidatus Sabulitectum sp.]
MLAFSIWIVSVIIGTAVLSKHNCGGTGFLLGFLLGPLGAIIAMVISGSKTNTLRDLQHNEMIHALNNPGQGPMKESCSKSESKGGLHLLLFVLVLSIIFMLVMAFR